MKSYRQFWFIFVLVCFCILITSCIGSITSNANKSTYSKFAIDYNTDPDAYNQYELFLKSDVNTRERIFVLIQLSYYGYELYPDKCLEHIKEAMVLSTKIDHKHENIGELFILYAKLHRQTNENYDPLPILKEGVEVLGNYVAKEFKKRSPYKSLEKPLGHELYVWKVNDGKAYMRAAGYNVGRDKRISIFYRIDRIIFGRLCITRFVSYLEHKLRDGNTTYFRDIYYYDFLSYYLDLAIHGYDILDMPDHRLAAYVSRIKYNPSSLE